MPSDTPPPVLPPVLPSSSDTPPPLPPEAMAKGRQLEGKLHPLTILFSAWAAVRGLFLPILVVVFASGRTGTGMFLLIFPAFSIVTGLVRYLIFSYRLENDELITRDGIFSRTERHIPLNRVQDIRIEQGVVHRMFKMADVYVETAGGKGAEASMSVLSRAEADRLRQAVFAITHAVTQAATVANVPLEATAGTPATTTTTAPGAASVFPMDEVVRQLSLKELILAGLTSNRMASVLVILFAAWGALDDILPKTTYERLAKFLVHEVEVLSHTETGMNWPLIIGAGVGVILLGAVFSAIGSVILFHGFILSRRGEDLHRTYGLFTRRSSSLPRKRIQLLKIEESWLRRLFRLVAVQADTAGSKAQNPEQKNDGRDVLLPILPKAELDTVLPVIVPDLDTTVPAWQQVDRCAIRRPVKKAFWFGLLGSTVILLFRQDLWLLAPMALLPVTYILTVLEYRSLGFALSERFFRTRRGWLSRTTHLVPIRNTQVVVLRQSPFDRRYQVMSLQVDTAGQTFTGGGPRITNVTADAALAIGRELAQRAARTRYRV